MFFFIHSTRSFFSQSHLYIVYRVLYTCSWRRESQKRTSSPQISTLCEAGLLDPSRDLLRLLDDDDDDDEEPSAPAVAPASAPAVAPASAPASAPPVAVEAPAAPVVEAAKEAEEAKPPALAVLGLVGRRPKEVLEEIYLCLGKDLTRFEM